MTRAGLSEDEFAERQAVRPLLAAHFIMWRTLEGPSLGEWFCECGLKFGLSDSAIDHQAAIVAARTADLAAQVALARALATDGVWGYGTKAWLASLTAALSPAQPDTPTHDNQKEGNVSELCAVRGDSHPTMPHLVEECAREKGHAGDHCSVLHKSRAEADAHHTPASLPGSAPEPGDGA